VPPAASPAAAGLGVVAPEPGWHDAWAPPAADPAPPWCEELLDTAWRAHRALLEAREAWSALDAERRASPAHDAAAEVRERDAVRMRDHVATLTAELEHLRAEFAGAAAGRAAAEERNAELDRRLVELDEALAAAHAEIGAMASSWQWKVGRVLVAPLRRARRVLGDR
jgi:hypothetical protein